MERRGAEQSSPLVHYAVQLEQRCMFGQIQCHQPQHRSLFTVSQILSAQKLSFTPYPVERENNNKGSKAKGLLLSHQWTLFSKASSQINNPPMTLKAMSLSQWQNSHCITKFLCNSFIYIYMFNILHVRKREKQLGEVLELQRQGRIRK